MADRTVAPVIVNLTRGRLAVFVDGRRVWVGSQDEWAKAREVAANYDNGEGRGR